jgi:hypothetical protein
MRERVIRITTQEWVDYDIDGNRISPPDSAPVSGQDPRYTGCVLFTTSRLVRVQSNKNNSLSLLDIKQNNSGE